MLFRCSPARATKSLSEEAKATADRQAGEVRQSLDIGRRTVEAMERTAERQLRAYLVARPGNLIVDDKRREGSYWLEWHPAIINTGQTPAYDVCSVARAEIRDEPLPPETNLMEELDPRGVGARVSWDENSRFGQPVSWVTTSAKGI